MHKYTFYNSIQSIFLISLMGIEPTLAGVVEPNVKWQKPQPMICWGAYADINKAFDVNDPPPLSLIIREFNPEERKLVETTIETEFTPNKTGIHYRFADGYRKDCDALVFGFLVSSGGLNEATIGDKGREVKGCMNRAKSRKLPNVILRIRPDVFGRSYHIGFNDEIQRVVTHEFGHLSGLRHEHADPQDPGDWMCGITKTITLEKLAKTSFAFTEYDPLSVMNYCFGNLLRAYGLSVTAEVMNFSLLSERLSQEKDLTSTDFSLSSDGTYHFHIGLSRGDRHALRCMYDRQYKESECTKKMDVLKL